MSRGMADSVPIGQLIARYRRRRGMTQRILADRVGITEDYLGAYGATAQLCLKLGEYSLGYLAAERAIGTADSTGETMAIAAAARIMAQAQLVHASYDTVIELSTAAARVVRPGTGSPPAQLSLYGSLHLRAMLAASRLGDRSMAQEFRREASRVAEKLGGDRNDLGTAFGPTNIRLHELTAALKADDIAWAVTLADRTDAADLPVERQVQGSIDAARAFSLWARHEDAARVIFDAHRHAPEQVRAHPLARETVREIHRRDPRSADGRIERLAREIGALP